MATDRQRKSFVGKRKNDLTTIHPFQHCLHKIKNILYQIKSHFYCLCGGLLAEGRNWRETKEGRRWMSEGSVAKEIARNYRQTAIKAFPTFTIVERCRGKGRFVRQKNPRCCYVLNFLPSLFPSLSLLPLPPHFGSACHIHHVVIGRSLMTTLHRITLAAEGRKRTAVDFTRGKLCQAEYTLQSRNKCSINDP